MQTAASLVPSSSPSLSSSRSLQLQPRLSAAQLVRPHEGSSAGLRSYSSQQSTSSAPHAAACAADAGASNAAAAAAAHAERPVSASGRPTRGLAAYRVRKQIGRGKFGVCQLVECADTGQPFVLKVIPLSALSECERLSALGEVETLKRLGRPKSHPFIVRYRESFLQQDALHIVMQHCAGGDLHAHLRARKAIGAYLPEEQILDWLIQLLLALRRCHETRIIHRDLKTQNIFLVPNKAHAAIAGTCEGGAGAGSVSAPATSAVGAYQIKLGDFGISKILNSTTDLAMSVVGTPYSMSPEVCENKPYSYQSDIWASDKTDAHTGKEELGCVVYEMCTLRHAFDANNLLGLVWRIVQESYPPIPSHYSVDLAELLSAMLAKDPQARPTVDQMLDLKFIKRRLRAQIKERLRAREAVAAAAAAAADGEQSDVRHHRRHTDSSSVASRSRLHRQTLSVSTSCSSHANVFDNNMSVTLPPDHERYDCDYFDGDGDGDGDECEIDAEGQEEMEKTMGSVSASASRQQGSDNEGDDPPAHSFSRPQSRSHLRPRSSAVHARGGSGGAELATEHASDLPQSQTARPPRLSVNLEQSSGATGNAGANTLGHGLLVPSSSSSPNTLSPSSAQLSARVQRAAADSPAGCGSGGGAIATTPTSASASTRARGRSHSDLPRSRAHDDEESYGDECDDIETQELLRSVRVGRRGPAIGLGLDANSVTEGTHSFKSPRGSVTAASASTPLGRLTSSLSPDALSLGARASSPCPSPHAVTFSSAHASPSHAVGGGGGSIFAGTGPEGNMVLLGRTGGNGTGSLRVSASTAASRRQSDDVPHLHSPKKRMVAFGTPTHAMSPSNAARLAAATAATAAGAGTAARSGASPSLSSSQHPSPSSAASASTSPGGARVTVNTGGSSSAGSPAPFEYEISSPRTPGSFARMGQKGNLPFTSVASGAAGAGACAAQPNHSTLPPPRHANPSAAPTAASSSSASDATERAKARRAAAQRIVQRGSFDDADDADGHNNDAAAPVQLSARPVRTHSDDDASGGSGSDEESLIEQLQSQLGTGADDSASECDENPERTYGLPTSDEEEGEECEDDESGAEEGEDDEEEDDSLQQLDPPQRHPSQRMVVESFSSKRTAPLRLQQSSSTRPRLHISRPISDSSRFGASADAAAAAVDAAGPPSPRASLSRQPSLREKRAAVRERCLRAMSERSFDLIFAHTLSQHILSPRSSAASQGAGGSSSAFGFEPASPTGAGTSESARNLRVVHQLLRGAGASAADIAAASAELVFSIQQLVNLQQMLDGAHSIDHDGP